MRPRAERECEVREGGHQAHHHPLQRHVFEAGEDVLPLVKDMILQWEGRTALSVPHSLDSGTATT